MPGYSESIIRRNMGKLSNLTIVFDKNEWLHCSIRVSDLSSKKESALRIADAFREVIEQSEVEPGDVISYLVRNFKYVPPINESVNE